MILMLAPIVCEDTVGAGYSYPD